MRYIYTIASNYSLRFVYLKLDTKFYYPERWHFDNDATSKIDDVLTEHGGLIHVLPLAVHLIFFYGQVGGTLLNLSYSLTFYVGPFFHA